MKKKFYTLIFACLLFSGMVSAQGLTYETFDDVSVLDNWQATNGGSYVIAQSEDAAEGTGSLDLTYTVVGDQGWGGVVGVATTPADSTQAHFEDAGDADGISFWYKVVTPGAMGQGVNFNVEIEVESTGGTELYIAQSQAVLVDESGEWAEFRIPFTGFAIPNWLPSLDGVLYTDKMQKIQMQVVVPEGVTSSGQILIDGLGTYQAGGTIIGTLLESFDVSGNIMTTQNSDGGSHFLSSSTDAVEGEGASCLFYN